MKDEDEKVHKNEIKQIFEVLSDQQQSSLQQSIAL